MKGEEEGVGLSREEANIPLEIWKDSGRKLVTKGGGRSDEVLRKKRKGKLSGSPRKPLGREGEGRFVFGPGKDQGGRSSFGGAGRALAVAGRRKRKKKEEAQHPRKEKKGLKNGPQYSFVRKGREKRRAWTKFSKGGKRNGPAKASWSARRGGPARKGGGAAL